MITTLTRIIKYGWQNFTRNAWLSTATIAVLVLALTVFLALILFNVTTRAIITSIEDKIDISVYFKGGTAEDDILNVQSQLKSLPEVKFVDYVSKDEALLAFKEKHQDDQTIYQALDQIGDNPFLASLNIKAYQPDQYKIISQYLDKDSIKPFVEKVSYAENATVIERLNKILTTAKRGGIALTALMALIGMLITFNTVRLAIYSSRESINIMRLVGGSNFFVRGPFLVEGVLYGLLSAVISVGIMTPVIYFVSPYGKVLVPEMDLWGYFVSHLVWLLLYGIVFGVALGLVSSFFAAGRHLRETRQ